MEKKVSKTHTLAHSRRQKENDTFSEIVQTLPLQEFSQDLDKASTLRLAINYIKLRELVHEGSEMEETVEEATEKSVPRDSGDGSVGREVIPASAQEPTLSDVLPNFSRDMLQAIDGFMLVFSADGQVLFASDTIAQYLGLRQVDVIGVGVADILHPQDCTELATIFQTQGQDTNQILDQKDALRRKFIVRMRCAFTPTVRSISRCSNFKPVSCSCYLKFAQSGTCTGQFIGLVALCKLVSPVKMREMVIGTFFKSKHSLDLSYTSLDRRIYWILGYDPSEMVGLKAYQYFHPEDLTATSSCHMNLLSRGQSNSPCYRLLSRWGDWMWVRSKSHMIYNKRTHLPEGIVIYTWIVRLDEEDERMLAIKEGKDGEAELKKYETFESSVSSTGGVLNVVDLIPKTIKRQTTPPTVEKVEPLLEGDCLATSPNSSFHDYPANDMNSFTLPSPPNSLSGSFSGSGSPEQQFVDEAQTVITISPSYKMSPPYSPCQGEMAGYISDSTPTHSTGSLNMLKSESISSPESTWSDTTPPMSQRNAPTFWEVSPQSIPLTESNMTPTVPLQFGMESGRSYSDHKHTGIGLGMSPVSCQQSASGHKQTFVNEARLRYSGSMPSAVSSHVTSHSNEETERITQWTQWLKGVAPAPVC